MTPAADDSTTPVALDPRLLARISGLELRARMLAEGTISGIHRSPYQGFSVEFVEHRKYSQGDDLKHLDWKVYGRSDKYYVKQYEQESSLRMMLVVDASESMAYRGDPAGLSKHEYAVTIAGAMAHLVLHQADAVGLAIFDDRVQRVIPAVHKAGQFRAMCRELGVPPGARKTRIRPVLDALAEQLDRRHLVVILSDLFDDPRELLKGVRHLRHRRHEPIVMHVMDHAELEFPFARRTRFRGLEGFEPLVTEPRVVRERYLAEVRRFVEQLRAGCHELNADYVLFDTDRPLDEALATYLANRQARAA